MRIFISAGEPSGDLHGANLIRAFKRLDPGIECVGFGGEQMEAAGCRIVYPLCRLAVMWFVRVLLNFHIFFRILALADRFFRRERPDAVVLIDYPGFHWWLARRAHSHGIPVVYFVPPQLWAWAGWRVHKMRRFVDHVLCNLPFEEEWYHARGVDARYIGHPYFDELAQQRLDMTFVAEQKAKPGTVIALLPGSRDQEIDRNLDMMLRAATRIHAARPETRFLVACLRPQQRERIEAHLRENGLPAEAFTGRMPEILHLAHSCISVSGSVGLEILYHGKPAVVVYRVSRLFLMVGRCVVTCPYMSLVNLLAGKELFPEFPTVRCEAEAISGHVLRWLNDPAAYQKLCGELAQLRQGLVKPGACDRAARYVHDVIEQRHQLGLRRVA